MPHHDNIILIGMAGAGKSTIGVLLAKALSREFVDIDLAIQRAEGMRLQQIIDAKGLDAFNEIEERHVLELDCSHAVVATGGSVVYSEPAMAHLKSLGILVYLELPLPVLQTRITNLDSRGLVIGKGQTFEELYAERRPLYERYADARVPCENLSHEQVVAAVIRASATPDSP